MVPTTKWRPPPPPPVVVKVPIFFVEKFFYAYNPLKRKKNLSDLKVKFLPPFDSNLWQVDSPGWQGDGVVHPNKFFFVYLHVLKVSASNGTKKINWYFFGRKLWSGLEPPSIHKYVIVIFEKFYRADMELIRMLQLLKLKKQYAH